MRRRRTGVWGLATCCALSVSVLAARSPSSSPGKEKSEPRELAPLPAEKPPPIRAQPSTAGAPSVEGLRLATWNLRWLDEELGQGMVKRSAQDYGRLAQYAEKLNADIVAVQEVESVRALQRVFPNIHYAVHLSSRRSQQRVGFAVRRGLSFRRHPDVMGLNVGQLRRGVDLEVFLSEGALRLLVVHLKSGCFSGRLNRSKACNKLGRQLPALESWIDERQNEGARFVVLGDFNRQLFGRAKDEVWEELNDGHPRGLMLWSPTAGRTSRCHEAYPAFIDHLVFNASARQLVAEGSFVEHGFTETDARYEVSDHCALSILLRK